MSKLEIITDHKWKPFKYRNEVPEKVLKSEVDWTTEEDVDGYFQYRGVWYHTSEFMRLGNGSPFDNKNWDGYRSDSFFSGVLIKLSQDGEEYKVGTYIS